MSETARLLSLFGGRDARRRADSISGWDEMQGYSDGYDTVGLSWGDIGHGLNLALNPIEQMKALGRIPGAIWNRGGGPAPGAAAPPTALRQGLPPAPMLPPGSVQAMQGGPRRLLSYMGLGTLTWASTDTLTEKTMTAEPQAAFRGRRLVISQAKTTGASGIAVTITKPLTVSGMPQTPAPDQAAPVEMFDASTTYSMLDLQIATSATQISLGISVSALPSSGNSVIVTAGLYGEWLR
jgi:hypothetical protein